MTPLTLTTMDAGYPARLRQRLGEDAPTDLTVLGKLDLLELPRTALFCSAHGTGNIILAAHDQAARAGATHRRTRE